MKAHDKRLISLIFFTLVLFIDSLAQVPGNQRGLYVDKFIILNNNLDINNTFSILGNSTNEDNLLNYCDRNHITYITLFDIRKIFLGNSSQVTDKKTLLSAFICKAKGSPHCITFVGASIGGFNTPNDVTDFDEHQTPAFIFQATERNTTNYNVLSFVEQDIPKEDPRFHNSECMKDALRLIYLHHPIYGIGSVPCSNGAPNNNIDIFTTEWEFWNGDPYDNGTPLDNIDYQDLVNTMNAARDLHNHSYPTELIYIETYLGFLSAPTNPTVTACDIASWVDGTYTGTYANYRRIDRVLAHYYNQDPATVYSQGTYYDPRFKDFCQANNDLGESCDGGVGHGQPVLSNDHTDYHPIFSGESPRLGSSPSDNFLGDYFTLTTSRNIFTAERDWYDDFKADNSDANIHDAVKGNDVSPGAAQWFAQSYLQNPQSNPVTFLSKTTACASSGNQPVTFTYQGPIEQGIVWTFSVVDWQGNIKNPSSGSTTGTTQNYNSNALPTLPNYSLGVDPNPQHPYTASLNLNYGSCSYTYSEKIYITDHIQIYALNHPTDYLGPFAICEGAKVSLRVNQITNANYQWQVNGFDIPNATNFEYTATVAGDFTCKVSNTSCNGVSNIIHIDVNSNPFRNILISCGGASTCSGGGHEVNLTIYPNNTQLGSGDTYLWNTSSSETNSFISVCDPDFYHVSVTRNGCTRFFTQQVKAQSITSASNPATPSITASPSNTVCFGSPVTLTSTPNAYIWSTGDLGNPLTKYNAGVYYSIVRNSSTRCQAISNFITVTTNLVNPTLSISSPLNSICAGDPITFTATPSNAGTVPQFEWSTNDGLTWNALTTNTTFSPVLPAGNYIIKARVLSNATCSSPLHIESSNAINFTVNAVPTVPILPTSNSPQCSNVGVNILHGTPPAGSTWYWQNSASGTSTSNSTSPYTVFSSGTFYLRAKNNTASCWSGAISINVIVNQNPTLSVIVNQNQSCPSVSDGMATANPTPQAGNYQYHWSLSALLTQSVSGLPIGSQTVYVTNTTGCSSNPATSFTINPATPACNNATYHVCAAPTNVASYFGSGFAGGTSTTHVRVAIHNDFIIDNNFTIQYADITIDPNVRIIINQNKTLNISNSSLMKCTTPWQGIVLNTGSVLTVTNSSEIDDAIVAVDAPGGSTINLWNSSFFRNDVSAYIHNGDFTNRISIYGNHFDFQNTDLKNPTATYHINVQQANNVLIGNPAQNKNYFTHVSIAINIFTSNVTIKNNDFFNIGHTIFTDALTWVTEGVAINGSGTGVPYSLSNIGDITGINDGNTFHNIECVGIAMHDNVDVNIKGNDFYEIGYLIELIYMASRQINISNNSFKNFFSGIYGVELTNATLDISRNRFNMISTHDTDPTQSHPELYSNLTQYGTSAISIQSGIQSPLFYNCHNNWIANCGVGIISRNLSANVMSDVIIQHNQIFYTHPQNAPQGYETGILLENCNQNQISNNHIESTAPAAPDKIYELGLTGIRFDLSPSNQIKENFILKMGLGMYGNYNCENTQLHCNNIKDFTDGIKGYKLKLTDQADIPNQRSFKNEWNGTMMAGSYRILGKLETAINWYYTSLPQTNPLADLITNNINSTLVPNGQLDCTVPTETSGVVIRNKYFEEVAFESAVYSSDPLFQAYDASILFYSGLNNDTSLLHLGTPDDIVYQNKYNELKNSNVGKFEKINKLIKSGDLQTAATIVNSVTDYNIMEQYKKKVTQIYLDCKINGHKPNISQKAILGPIAYQLGVYGGEATYMARALLNIFVDENHSTARMRAPEFYTNGKMKVEQETHSKFNYIYPNPASNELNFLLPDNFASDKHIRISDCYGGSKEWIKWEGNTKELTINTQNYSAGVYFVTLFINNEEIQTNRVVIIH